MPSAVSKPNHVGHCDVVVDRFGQGDDVEAGLLEMERVFLRAAAAEANEGVEVFFLVVLDDDVGECRFLSPPICMRVGLSRLVPRIVPPTVRMPGQRAD